MTESMCKFFCILCASLLCTFCLSIVYNPFFIIVCVMELDTLIVNVGDQLDGLLLSDFP